MRATVIVGSLSLLCGLGCRQGNPPRFALHEQRVEAQVREVAPEPIAELPRLPRTALRHDEPLHTCYALTRHKSRSWRANAVQERLARADSMAATLDPHQVDVELMGDHADLLVLTFPAAWPDGVSYAARVSAILRSYLDSPEVSSAICEVGFEQIQLTARNVADDSLHPVWTARVTREGLQYVNQDEGVELAVVAPEH